MTTDQEMRKLADNATDGPWEVTRSAHDGVDGESWVSYGVDHSDHEIIHTNHVQQDDARFIAASRQWVPDAIRRLDAIRELIDPSKAVKGSIASKILKILDGEQ